MMYLFQVSICTLLFYLVYHFLYKNKTEHVFNRGYLLAALMLSLLFPLLHIPIFPEYIELYPAMKTNGLIKGKELVEVPLFTWENCLILIYVIGVFVHLFMLTYRLYYLSMVIKKGEKEADKDCIKVYTNSEIPVSSFLSYLIIPEEQKAVITDYELQHEKCHIRQKHSIDILFIAFYRVLFWFNPVLLFYKKRMVEVHEYLADQSTLQQLGKTNYEDFLIQQISLKTQQSLVHNFYSLFKNRIHMMNSKAKTSTWQYLMVLPVVAFSLFLFSCETYPVYTDNDQSLDKTYPAVSDRSEVVDTIVIFDPKTQKETVQIVRRTTSTDAEKMDIVKHTQNEASAKTGIDTVIVFDPDTYKETMIIINHEAGTIDTIQ